MRNNNNIQTKYIHICAYIPYFSMNIHMCILNSKTQQPTVSPLHRTEKFENSIKSKIYIFTVYMHILVFLLFSRNGGGSLWEQFQLN